VLTEALSLGNAKVLAPNNCNLNVFYEAFATVFIAFARVVLDAPAKIRRNSGILCRDLLSIGAGFDSNNFVLGPAVETVEWHR
jgi:hypothetical protein